MVMQRASTRLRVCTCSWGSCAHQLLVDLLAEPQVVRQVLHRGFFAKIRREYHKDGEPDSDESCLSFTAVEVELDGKNDGGGGLRMVQHKSTCQRLIDETLCWVALRGFGSGVVA